MMAVEYKSIVPWGRSYDEYIKMFNLSEKDLNKKILGCGDGPAAFNAQLTRRNGKVVSIDPIYQYSKEQILERINETFDVVMEQTKNNFDRFVWNNIKNIEELGKIRMEAMKEFISDYEIGKTEKRYIYGELPIMPNLNIKFDIALS
ncbi:MAG: SAM-dependent methyltransferase, partial [Legionellales bacterium]|nr:SAM-dependent methyltransferase [Legionellales bacterium]